MKKLKRILAWLLTLCLLSACTAFAYEEEVAENVVEDIIEETVADSCVENEEEVTPGAYETFVTPVEETVEAAEVFSEITIEASDLPVLPDGEEIPLLPEALTERTPGGCRHFHIVNIVTFRDDDSVYMAPGMAYATSGVNQLGTSGAVDPGSGTVYMNYGDPLYHTVYAYKVKKTVCLDCLETRAEQELGWGSLQGKHYYNDDGVCVLCGYAHECTHPSVRHYCGEPVVNYESAVCIDGRTHQVEITDRYYCECTVCGLNWFDREGEPRTVTAPHVYEGSGQICTVCDYECACTHPYAYKTIQVVDTDIELVNEKTHIRREHGYPCLYCPDCENVELLGDDIIHNDVVEPHTYVGGYCSLCEHTNTCKHTHTTKAEGWNDVDALKPENVVCADDKTHTILGEWCTYTLCKDCGERLKLTSSVEQVTEAHAYGEDGWCKICRLYAKPINLTGVSIAPGAAQNLKVDETLELSAVYKPVNATATATWKSSNEKVATVDEKGLVTAVGEGSAKITVTAKGNVTKTATLKLTVVDPNKLTALSLEEKGPLALEMNRELSDPATVQLNPVVQPEAAMATTVITWKSSSTKVATVDDDGLVTACAAGTVTITATAKRGSVSKSASVKLSITDPYKPKSMSFTQKDTIRLALGERFEDNETAQIIPVLAPRAEADAVYTWKTSNPKAVVVDEEGTVTAVSDGSAKITCTAKRGTVTMSRSIQVSVYDPYKPTMLLLEETSTQMELGLTKDDSDSLELTPYLEPDREAEATYTWKSKNKAVATVDEDGIVTAVGKGSSIITCTAKRGTVTKYASVTVYVTDPYVPTGITLNETGTVPMEFGLTSAEDDILELAPSFEPFDGIDANITWKSSNTKAARVDEDGRVTPVGPGSASITCTVKRSGVTKTASVKVAVTDPYRLTNIALDQSGTVPMKLGKSAAKNDTLQLNATIASNPEAEAQITWKSSAPKVATVDEDGLVTAIAKGSATITVTAKRGADTKTAKVKISVTDPYALTALATDSPVEERLVRGATTFIEPATTPSGTAVEITYKSSAPKVVSVTEEGRITALAKGTATITITAKRYGVTKTAKVKVIVTA